jgi:hypothetical protein
MAPKRIGTWFPGQVVPVQIDHSFAIPTSFVALDSNVSAADAFVNTRDEMVKRQNHNVLIAKRCKRNVLHEIGGAGHIVGQRQAIDPLTAPPEKVLPLYLSQHTRQIAVVVEAMHSRAATAQDSNPQLGFLLCALGANRDMVAAEIQAITTVYAASPEGEDWGQYVWTLDVPANDGEACLKYGHLHFNLQMYAYAPIKSASESAGHAITASDDMWIETASNVGDRSDKVLVIDHGGGIVDRRLVHRTVNNSKHLIDAPWSTKPNPGTNTVSTYLAMYIALGSLSVYELNATALREQPERG